MTGSPCASPRRERWPALAGGGKSAARELRPRPRPAVRARARANAAGGRPRPARLGRGAGGCADGAPALPGGRDRAGPVVFERLDWRPYGIRPAVPIAAAVPPGEPTRLDTFRARLARDLRERIASADRIPSWPTPSTAGSCLCSRTSRFAPSSCAPRSRRCWRRRRALGGHVAGRVLLGETGRDRAERLAYLRSLDRGRARGRVETLASATGRGRARRGARRPAPPGRRARRGRCPAATAAVRPRSTYRPETEPSSGWQEHFRHETSRPETRAAATSLAWTRHEVMAAAGSSRSSAPGSGRASARQLRALLHEAEGWVARRAAGTEGGRVARPLPLGHARPDYRGRTDRPRRRKTRRNSTSEPEAENAPCGGFSAHAAGEGDARMSRRTPPDGPFPPSSAPARTGAHLSGGHRVPGHRFRQPKGRRREDHVDHQSRRCAAGARPARARDRPRPAGQPDDEPGLQPRRDRAVDVRRARPPPADRARDPGDGGRPRRLVDRPRRRGAGALGQIGRERALEKALAAVKGATTGS